MKGRLARVSYVVVGFAALVVLARVENVRLRFSLTTSLWFEVLVWMLLAAFILEPFFSGPTAAITNAFTASFVVLGSGYPTHQVWWFAVLVAALTSFVFVTAAYVIRDGRRPSARVAAVAKALETAGSALGSWRCLATGCLVLAIATFNAPFGRVWMISTLGLVYCLTLARARPHEWFAAIWRAPSKGPDYVADEVMPPAELVVTPSLRVGETVVVSGSGANVAGLVIAETFLDGRRASRVFVPSLSRAAADGSDVAIAVGPDVLGTFSSESAELASGKAAVVGVMSDATSADDLRVELFQDQRVDIGQLLWTTGASGRLFWQVSDAELGRQSWGGDRRRVVSVSAPQLGSWDEGLMGFQPVSKSPALADLVFSGEDIGAQNAACGAGRHAVGQIPRSEFPVVVDLRQLSLHHTAILGTTGTGKTHLAFDLVHGLAESGVNVVCVDATGQYRQRFPEPEHAHVSEGAVKDFLDGDKRIAVYSLDPKQNAIDETNKLAKAVFKWASGKPYFQADENARCVLLLEEAHNYIPEGFQIDDWRLKAAAQDTSRLLMESRKFGLGFILVSQRTAMVTKSALSQCNTVFAFQAFDQTGLDYLAGLCGSALARAIPTLPARSAVAMGRGLTSARPVIFRVREADITV